MEPTLTSPEKKAGWVEAFAIALWPLVIGLMTTTLPIFWMLLLGFLAAAGAAVHLVGKWVNWQTPRTRLVGQAGIVLAHIVGTHDILLEQYRREKILEYEQIPVSVESPTVTRLVVGERAVISLTMKSKEPGLAVWKYDGFVILNNLGRWTNRFETDMEAILQKANTAFLEKARVEQLPTKLRLGDTPYSISSRALITPGIMQRLQSGMARLYFVSSIDYGDGVLWTCGYLTKDLQMIRYCADYNVAVPRGSLF